jgi:chorismate mutase
MRSAQLRHASLLFAGIILLAGHAALAAIGSAFTYQGRLSEGGNEANGSYLLRFSLYDGALGGTQIGVSATNAVVVVSNGIFTVALDFGTNAFDGSDRWMEIAVGTGTNDFTVLSPRQPITPAPYAMTAANLSGPLPDSQVPAGVARLSANQTFAASNIFSGVVVLSNAANAVWGTFVGSFGGDGSGLTNLNTSVVTAATNDLNTALSAKIVAATNDLNTALPAKIVAATNDLNTALSAKIAVATNDLNTALSAKTVAATNDLNTALSAKIAAATNTTWIATTNWVGTQGYQVTNGLTRKAILSPVVSSGTNYVVDFSSEVAQMTATNNINLVQSTNRTTAGWYGECVWYIRGGTANWTLRVNTNWVAVGTLATNVPYVVASNKLTIVALSVRGGSETNVTYAISRQE